MRRLIARLRAERGASAVLFGLMLIPLVGAAGIAVDVGALYAERAQLQNGADAVALRIAIACSRNESTCSASNAGSLAGDNALDGVAAIGGVTIDRVGNLVTVSTNSEDIGVRHPLASMLPGIGDATVVHATGAAEWGVPIRGTTIPLAIAECELTGRLATLDAANPSRILLRSDTNAPCPSGPPGGFGWLSDGDCEVTLGDNAVVVGTTGNNPGGTGCTNAQLDLLGKTVLVPLYDLYQSQGSHGSYTISRFAAFYITGTKFGGNSTERYLNGVAAAPTFSGSARGLQGYFVRYVSLSDAFELGDGPDLGSYVVRLTLRTS
ncbi:TadE/TadG family type IV pilus assembly protein [Agromyces sp. NPDC056379]|uniref:TadE/TadG family type IV pilus assembly protein n=1 Tax=unclassified Agromyces TaxID=2639701 RepID=UPI0035E167B4